MGCDTACDSNQSQSKFWPRHQVIHLYQWIVVLTLEKTEYQSGLAEEAPATCRRGGDQGAPRSVHQPWFQVCRTESQSSIYRSIIKSSTLNFSSTFLPSSLSQSLATPPQLSLLFINSPASRHAFQTPFIFLALLSFTAALWLSYSQTRQTKSCMKF